MGEDTRSRNTIKRVSLINLYLDLNDLLALVEDGDNDPDGFITI